MDSQCLSNCSGSAGELGNDRFLISPPEHQVNAVFRNDCPNKDSVRDAFYISDDVEQVVDAITEVNICNAPFLKHDLSP